MKKLKLFEEFEYQKAQVFPCTFTIMTDRNRDGIRSVKNDGYHFFVENEDELSNLEKKYQKGDIYNGETITSTSINPANYGEFNEGIKDELKDEVLSTIQTEGSMKEHEEEIKQDILDYIDSLLDEEAEGIQQLVKLQKGEISQEEVDIQKLMEIGNKLNQSLMSIVRKYNKPKR